MPEISAERLQASLNRWLMAAKADRLNEVLARLAEVHGNNWWHLVVDWGQGEFRAIRFAELAWMLERAPMLAFEALADLNLPVVLAIDRFSYWTEDAADLARQQPTGLVVVTEAGSPVGILFEQATLSGGEGPDLLSLNFPTSSDEADFGDDAGAGPQGQPERVVSTGFAPQTAPGAALERTTTLQSGQDYYFWLEIGQAVADSIETAPISLPAELHGPEARLKVVLFAFSGSLRLTPGAEVGELQLAPDGSVRVTRQAEPVSELAPGAGILQRRLFFPVRTPDQEGTFRLRCNLYSEQLLVQSRLIETRVTRAPAVAAGALRATLDVDYNLSAQLDPAQLARIAPHRLSVIINDDEDGTHSFRFFGARDGREFYKTASFDAPALQNLIDQARGGLRRAAWGDELPWDISKPYRYGALNYRPQLRDDLVRLAIRGYRFYFQIVQKFAGALPQVAELAELMREPGYVQIALRASARLIVPAALTYDSDLDTDADFASFQLCPSFLAALDGPSPLEECRCFQGDCPSRGQDTVVCPSGFWGFRHYLGLPLSAPAGTEACLEIPVRGEPELLMCVSTDQDLVQRPPHERLLQTLVSSQAWHYADSRLQTFKLLQATRPQVVYFYCHGGLAGTVPFIAVGAKTDPGITPDNLLLKHIYWDSPRPFIFINGCHTTAVEPEVALEFVSAFVRTSNAAGVMGTEITIFESLARGFAEEFLRRFLQGLPAGQAVRAARLALLKLGDPLGLVYIPFVVADLHLARQTAPVRP